MSSCILSVILCLTSGVYVNNNAILTFHEGHNCIFLFIVVEHHFVTSSTILWLEILIKYIKYETIKAVFNVRNISHINKTVN
jgi:hypothetical protein